MRSLNQCIVVPFLLAGSIAAYGQRSLSGKWRGTENNLPLMDLTIEQKPATPLEALSSTS